MKLTKITLTGADDTTNTDDLRALSKTYPIVEWGILLSAKRQGDARYPGADFLQRLANTKKTSPHPMHCAAHLCGGTMRAALQGIPFASYDEGRWLAPFGLSELGFNSLFGRTQINFDAARERLTRDDIAAILEGWYETMDGALITQHNTANADVWHWAQAYEHRHPSVLRAHQILHDASGGNGLYAPIWNHPIAGFLNGYAGGLGPDTVVDTLMANEDVVGDGLIWIDMEGALRGNNDTFDLDKAATVLDAVMTTGSKRGWLLG